MTQNTNWGNVEKAISNLKDRSPFNANALHKMHNEQLASLIKPAGYFNIKAKRLKEFIAFVVNHYKGSMEKMKSEDPRFIRQSLLNVNGIGPETADSILLYALEKPVFVIDAYTKRVLVRHKIVLEKTAYHEIQELFYKSLPRDAELFNEYHALFVRLGKDYCKTKPECGGCPLESLSF